METTKQVILVLFSAILIVGMTLAGMSSLKVDASTTVSWNFKNTSFKNLGTISSTTAVDGLTLVATDSLTMQVKAKNATVSGTVIPMLWRLVGEVTKTAELSRFQCLEMT